MKCSVFLRLVPGKFGEKILLNVLWRPRDPGVIWVAVFIFKQSGLYFYLEIDKTRRKMKNLKNRQYNKNRLVKNRAGPDSKMGTQFLTNF